jgi:hypothetical protein
LENRHHFVVILGIIASLMGNLGAWSPTIVTTGIPETMVVEMLS